MPKVISAQEQPDVTYVGTIVGESTSREFRLAIAPETVREQDIVAVDARLSNRPEINVLVDGHDVVTRHLAILAMTGAGKSWTSRRIIEQLADKNYPIVIFDPHGDYTGLADVPGLGEKVKRFYASFPVFEEDAETVASIVDTLGYALTET